MQNIYLKVDANNDIGYGHLHRCLSIAQVCSKKNINTNFIITNPTLYDVIRKNHFKAFFIEKQQQFIYTEYLKIIPQNSLIIFDTDDYFFYSGQLISELKKQQIKTACFTITDKYHISTNFLINTNIISLTHSYITPNNTTKLLGTQYLIFHKAFRNLDDFNKDKHYNTNLLLFFGNADKEHISLFFVKHIEKLLPFFDRVNILIGKLNNDLPQIEKILKQKIINKINLLVNISPEELIKLYKQTDLFITSGGMSMWEAALFKIPQLVIASSQREIEYTDYLYENNYILKLGNYTDYLQFSNIFQLLKIIKEKSYNKLNLTKFRSIINHKGIELLCEELNK